MNSKMSAPDPPVKVSFPDDPLSRSLPAPPFSVSSPCAAQRTSFPSSPLIVISRFASRKSDEVRSITSLPAPALIVSRSIIRAAVPSAVAVRLVCNSEKLSCRKKTSLSLVRQIPRPSFHHFPPLAKKYCAVIRTPMGVSDGVTNLLLYLALCFG